MVVISTRWYDITDLVLTGIIMSYKLCTSKSKNVVECDA